MEMNRDKPNASVAVFDSGIGGLNLLAECAAALPDVDFYYLADNFNVPYGNKRKNEILALVNDKLSLLSGVKLSAAVIACNTATANCIGELRAQYPFPVIGIQPAVKPAAEHGGKCLVLATPSTVESDSFKNLLARVSENRPTDFIIHACEGLAEYVEQNVFDLDKELPKTFFPQVEVDSVVLGCTHYVFIKEAISKLYNCEIFDGISGTAANLCRKLGMTDHFKGFLGIFDHSAENKSNITFLGGDFEKNARIFSKLMRERVHRS